jgi:hypothetical protein
VKTWPARVPSSLPALPSPPPLFLSTGGGELGFSPGGGGHRVKGARRGLLYRRSRVW